MSKALAPLDLARVLSVVVIWGVNNVMAKVVLEVLPPMLVVALRFTIVLVLLAPLLRPLPKATWRLMAATLFLVGALHFGIQYTGLRLARDLSPMVIAMQLWIPCSVVFAGVLLRERSSPMRQVGVAVAFVGIVGMSFDPMVFAQLGALALVALAAALYGLGAVLVRVQASRGAAMDPWSMQAWIALFAAPVMGVGSALFEHGQIEAMRHVSWVIWAFIVFGAIVSSIIANVFMFQLVQRYEVARVTPFMLMTPVVSFVLAALVLGDHISVRVALGAAITLSGVALAALAEQRFKRAVITAEP